ncbi:MAG: 16S rRNA processing protein RimM [Oleiphilaceae bacterium]|jgi:16S rRNA processing protein RimM
MSKNTQNTVMGKVTSIFGVKGWVKVFSYTQPKENICQYINWQLQDQSGATRSVKVLDCKPHGNGFVALFDGAKDRDLAKLFCGMLVTVPSSELPSLSKGEYYWSQLQGLSVYAVNSAATESEPVLLGKVDHLIETGSNDVLVVKKCKDSLDGQERLIPYLPDQVVKLVDLHKGIIEVDWDPDF